MLNLITWCYLCMILFLLKKDVSSGINFYLFPKMHFIASNFYLTWDVFAKRDNE